MERREFIRMGGYGALLLLASRGTMTYGQSFNIQEIRNGVGYFTEAGGTIGWLRSPEGWVIVDAQFPHSAAHLIAELSKKESGFHLLINTHHHGDHTAGNIAFKGLVKDVYAHENALDHLREATKEANEMYFPTRVFKDTEIIATEAETIELSYYGAAHTDGDAIVHFQNANIVHMGDLVFNRRYPYIDKEAGADISSWIRILDQTRKRFDADTVFIFGHAAEGRNVTGNRDDLSAFSNYLEKLLAYVSREKRNGKTLEQLLQSSGIPGAQEWQGEGIERSIRAAWSEV